MFLSESGTGPYEADQYANCSIVPTSMGGSDYVGLPFDLYLSGDRTAGTATIRHSTAIYSKLFSWQYKKHWF